MPTVRLVVHYAVVGIDGGRFVVWGVGSSVSGAVADALYGMASASRTGDEPLVTVVITQAQRHAFEVGTVAVNDLDIVLEPTHLKTLTGSL
jgi:hypothetical protein